ncbi:MAG: hypothetical protein K6G27_09360, partial [Lachnospiraceae bacterium]|nr:hypothetical protein [Lachnospiraceae bacterium]
MTFAQEADDNKQNKVKAYISEITFNNGEILPIENNDIVLFVGPNNVGKSQSLNDIYTKCAQETPTIVISNVKTHKNEGSLIELIKEVSKVTDRGNNLEFIVNGCGLVY